MTIKIGEIDTCSLLVACRHPVNNNNFFDLFFFSLGRRCGRNNRNSRCGRNRRLVVADQLVQARLHDGEGLDPFDNVDHLGVEGLVLQLIDFANLILLIFNKHFSYIRILYEE